jgi:hypothetical protein
LKLGLALECRAADLAESIKGARGLPAGAWAEAPLLNRLADPKTSALIGVPGLGG